MGEQYTVLIAKYPYKGYWESYRGFKTFKSAVKFAKKSMRQGYNIIDINCRDIKKDEILNEQTEEI